MKICVLQPDYSPSEVDYKNYDPARALTALLPGHEVEHVFLNKLSTYYQLKQLKKKGFDIFINLCEGYLEWNVPSIDVITSMDLLNLPYTGPTAELYDPPKPLMKYVAYTCGIKTPAYKLLKSVESQSLAGELKFPLFLKPAKAGDSLGIDFDSKILSSEALHSKVQKLLDEHDELLLEEYIPGREYTVLISRKAGTIDECNYYTPVEYIFPEGYEFKSYALKTSALHPDANVPCTDVDLAAELNDAARKIFNAFNGEGYARLDFRLAPDGTLYFLEINFTCSVFYSEGYEGSADHILNYSEGGKKQFLQNIIDEGVARHARRSKKFVVKVNALSGYGIYANRDIEPGEVIFQGEGMEHRVVTKSFVEKNWQAEEKENFRKYAWPLSDQLYILWSARPSEWAPQNHSCDPNTVYVGLNVVALRSIKKNEELTLDYSNFLNEEMESFICNCQAAGCRKVIQGRSENSISFSEKKRLNVNGTDFTSLRD